MCLCILLHTVVCTEASLYNDNNVHILHCVFSVADAPLFIVTPMVVCCTVHVVFYHRLVVRRDQLLLDAYEEIMSKKPKELKYHKLNVEFDGEPG